jgi:hypothetical protein
VADVLVKPAFFSPYLDGPDATMLQPSYWNAARLFTGGSDGQVIVRSAASATGAAWTATPVLTSLAVGGAVAPGGVEGYFVSTSASDPRGLMSAQYSTDATGARIHLRKGRGTEAAPTVVVTGDTLGRLRFSGYDGTNYLQMASVDAIATGTIAATRVPTYLAFSVATDAAPSVLTEVLRLTPTGITLGAPLLGAMTTSVTNIVTTSTDGSVLQNTTAATAGVPVQLSPRLRLSGTGWNTGSVATETDSWFVEVLPVSASPTNSFLRFGKTIGAGAITYPFTLNSNGTPAFLAGGSFGGIVTVTGVSISGRNILLTGAPTIASGFNTSPTLPGGICANSFQVNTGATPATNTAVITMGATAAAGWAVHANDLSDTVNVCQVATSTTQASFKAYSKTTGLQVAWPASATINFLALAY